MKRIFAMLLACLLLAGCSAAPAKSGKEEKLETVDVVLDWYPNAVHAFIYEAIDKGYFADEGLQVNVLFPSNATDPLTMTAAGKADIGFYYQEDTIIAKANEGVPVKVLGAVAGCVIYRFIIAIALRLDLPSECLKLISAVIVALAIGLPALKKGRKASC